MCWCSEIREFKILQKVLTVLCNNIIKIINCIKTNENSSIPGSCIAKNETYGLLSTY